MIWHMFWSAYYFSRYFYKLSWTWINAKNKGVIIVTNEICNVQFPGPFWPPSTQWMQFQLIDFTSFIHTNCIKSKRAVKYDIANISLIDWSNRSGASLLRVPHPAVGRLKLPRDQEVCRYSRLHRASDGCHRFLLQTFHRGCETGWICDIIGAWDIGSDAQGWFGGKKSLLYTNRLTYNRLHLYWGCQTVGRICDIVRFWDFSL